MNEMPVLDWVKGMSQANFANPEFRSWVKWAKETDYYKNRRSGGWNKDLVFLMNYARFQNL